jgi:ParB family transcriptional regulator, chromosome partitioning protein
MAETDTENLQELDTGLIDPSPYQPRRVFDETALLALADSIRQHGMLQPVMVRAVGDRYELILGERRVRACQRLGRPVLARIQDLSDADAEREALAENLLRAPLSAMEKARAFGTLAL